MSEQEHYEVRDDGLRILTLMTYMGHRCGYVGINKQHPLHGIDYQEETPILEPMLARAMQGTVGDRGILALMGGARPSADVVFDVHGSVTFSGELKGHDGVWWFGFDCAHMDDTPTAWSRDRVIAETHRFADQLTEVVNDD